LKDYWLTRGYVGLYPATTLPGETAVFNQLAGAEWNISADGVYTRLSGAEPRARLLSASSVSGGTARMISDTPGNLVVDVDAHPSDTLALTERFDEGWSARIDGRATAISRVQSDFLGVSLEPGAHRVELVFAPASVRWGAIVSAAGLIALVVGAYLTAFYSR
jgi:hypothetical protein